MAARTARVALLEIVCARDLEQREALPCEERPGVLRVQRERHRLAEHVEQIRRQAIRGGA